MVDGLALWKQLLQVQEPWVVQACRADEFNRCMAVWIGVEAPRSWFGLGRPRVAEGAPRRPGGIPASEAGGSRCTCGAGGERIAAPLLGR
jgi:hypothetical protein